VREGGNRCAGLHGMGKALTLEATKSGGGQNCRLVVTPAMEQAGFDVLGQLRHIG